MKITQALLTTAMLVGCGALPATTSSDQATTSTDLSQAEKDKLRAGGALYLDAVADLPTCNAAALRQLVYVAETSKFYYCSAKPDWVAVDLKGKDGAAGAVGAAGTSGVAGKDGVAGADGSAGKDGNDNHIAVSIGCVYSLQNVAPLDVEGLDAYYTVDVTTAGDVFATFRIEGPGYDSSSSAVYSAKQPGAVTGPVVIGGDMYGDHDYGYWQAEYFRDTQILSIEYHDQSLTGGERAWVAPISACTVQN